MLLFLFLFFEDLRGRKKKKKERDFLTACFGENVAVAGYLGKKLG